MVTLNKTEADIQEERNFWLRLDNAAKIYPAIRNSELTSVIRISVELKERIKAKHFLEAIAALENRFPYYKVILKPGFFWYYLDYKNSPIPVKSDTEIPCREFNEDEMMFRVLVKTNRISVEFSHILTDGTGAFEFLKAILFTYFEKCGHLMPPEIPFCSPHEGASEEEFEDAFNKYFEKRDVPPISTPKAFHLPFKLRNKPRFDILLGVIPMDQIVKKAKEHEVSLTEYLIAVYLYALQEVYYELGGLRRRRSNKKVRIQVPMNLRRMYPTKTMRNFSLYVMPEIDLRLGKYTFEELSKLVHHQMQLETDKKLINKIISKNVGGERNIFVRGIPLIIKSIILSLVYSNAIYKYSGVITNLGKIDFGPDLNRLIERFVFVPPPVNKVLKVNCGVVGFGNKLILSFGNITNCKKLEKSFFKLLVSEGISVKIEKY